MILLVLSFNWIDEYKTKSETQLEDAVLSVIIHSIYH